MARRRVQRGRVTRRGVLDSSVELTAAIELGLRRRRENREISGCP